MLIKVTVLWVVGLLTIVPYGVYHLLFHAQRDEYALLITLVLFWIFGFWGVASPILAAIKIRQVLRALERAQSKEKLLDVLQNQDSQDFAIELLASENRIPRFLAKKIYFMALRKLSDAKKTPDTSVN